MKIQKNFTLSPIAVAQLGQLAALYGTATKALEVAIERLWQGKQAEGRIITVAKADGIAFDFPAMREGYGQQIEAVGKQQARRELLASIRTHVNFVLPDQQPGYKRRQVELAANAVFAHYRQPPLAEIE